MEINEGAALEAEKIASDYLARVLPDLRRIMGEGRPGELAREAYEAARTVRALIAVAAAARGEAPPSECTDF